MRGAKRICSALVICAFALGLPAATVRAQVAAGKIAAADDFNIQLAEDPQISPDGKQIVYVREWADIMTDKRYTNLWIVAADGSGHRPLTTGLRNDGSPRWSPDGTRIAFVGLVAGHAQILVRWMDSGQTAVLTNLEETPGGINWSPDGKTLSFTSLVPGKAPHLADLPAPPEGAKWASPAKAYDQLVYRFNDIGYLKPGYTQIFVVSADGGAPRQVSSGDFQNGGWAEINTVPVWTPDGKYLIASINRHANYQAEPFDTDIYEFAVADGTAKALTSRKGPDNEPAISPDGKRIAYTGFDDRYQGYEVTKLYVMNRDGSGAKSISDKLDRDVSDPVWAGDGGGIYFKYVELGQTKIGFYSNDGNFKKIADHVASGRLAYGFAGAFTASRNGAIAFTYGTGLLPGDVAVASGGGAPRVLTTLNRELLSQKKPGAVEEIWWESSKDKRKIEGWVVKPPDFDPAKKYPLILEIHGGPFADYGDRFDLEKQAWASMGYVVLYANPRGSTGYGAEFGNLIHHAYPGDDFYDLNSGVDAVIAKGYIDTNNLFVTGGSGGGVLTCWMIEHTERFRAAVVFYPVINWYSFVLTSDIPWTAKYWFPANPWEQTDHYMQRSLTNLVGKVKTPSLIMTGEEDYRTPISEGEQFYTALKLQDVESVMVRVPNEPHGIHRFPSHLITKVLYVGGWFDQHKSK
ncbi:MAG TPA: S9 family peptidase [Candidatus Dormibacteraeota bacterium]|nr:S9 family peptidase [Candidatus Dormibacteraeota bacterium]